MKQLAIAGVAQPLSYRRYCSDLPKFLVPPTAFSLQGTSSRIVKEAREDLVKKISSMARVAAGSQEAKRREMSTKMQDLVSKSEAGIAQKALRWNTVRLRVSSKYNMMDGRVKDTYVQRSVDHMDHLVKFGGGRTRSEPVFTIDYTFWVRKLLRCY